jgi:hypothetical protein
MGVEEHSETAVGLRVERPGAGVGGGGGDPFADGGEECGGVDFGEAGEGLAGGAAGE